VKSPQALPCLSSTSLALSLALSFSLWGCGNQKPIGASSGPDSGDGTGAAADGDSAGGPGTSDATPGVAAPDAAGAPDTAALGPDASPPGSEEDGGDGASSDGGLSPGDGPPVLAACELPQGLPLAGRFVPNVPYLMHLAFDQGPNLVAVDMTTHDLLAIPYQGAPVSLIPAAVRGFGRGINVLPTGGFLVLDGNQLVTLTPQGNRTVIGTLENPANVILDPQGRPVVSDGPIIERLDGNRFTVLSRDPRGGSALAFSPDGATLYVVSPDGEIRQLAIGPDGKAGPQRPLASIPRDGVTVIVTGMVADECGNLYVVNAVHEVWRVTPAGGLLLVVKVKQALGGLRFGSGRGGWKDTALYLAQPTSSLAATGVLEVDLGFRGARPPGAP
jgi:hypothetical protein